MERKVKLLFFLLLILLPVLLIGAEDTMPMKTFAYDYFISKAGQPYSERLTSEHVFCVVQYPGMDGSDGYVKNVFMMYVCMKISTDNMQIKEIHANFKPNNMSEIIPSGISYLIDSDDRGDMKYLPIEEWKVLVGIKLPKDKYLLIGFGFDPKYFPTDVLEGTLNFSIVMDSDAGKETIETSQFLTRVKESKNAPDCNALGVKREMLVGDWWNEEMMKNEYTTLLMIAANESLFGKVAADNAKKRLISSGYMPAMRWGRYHFKGFFMHMDSE